jgi:DNA-binding NarL/FixJ family response regulator
MSAPITILIIDDHFAARLGLKVAIENEIGMTVVAQGASVEDAVRLYDQHEPRVVLMDYALGKWD